MRRAVAADYASNALIIAPLLLDLSVDADPEIRQECAQALLPVAEFIWSQEEQASAQLAELEEAGDESVPEPQDVVLGLLRRSIEMLKDPEQAVQDAAMDTVGSLASLLSSFDVQNHVVEPLLELCRDEDPEVRAVAGKVLFSMSGQMEQAGLLDVLSSLVSDFSQDPFLAVRLAAADGVPALCQLMNPSRVELDVLPLLSRLCDDMVWSVRKSAATAIPKVARCVSYDTRVTKVMQLFRCLIDDMSHWVKQEALAQLVGYAQTLRSSDISQELVDDFCSMATQVLGDPEVCEACARDIATIALCIGPGRWSELREALSLLTASPHQEVRRQVARSLPRLVTLFSKHEDLEDVRSSAAQLLDDDCEEVLLTLAESAADLITALPHDMRLPLTRQLLFLAFQNVPEGALCGSWRLREAVVRELGKLWPALPPKSLSSAVFPFFLTMCKDPVSSVRQMAAGQMGLALGRALCGTGGNHPAPLPRKPQAHRSDEHATRHGNVSGPVQSTAALVNLSCSCAEFTSIDRADPAVIDKESERLFRELRIPAAQLGDKSQGARQTQPATAGFDGHRRSASVGMAMFTISGRSSSADEGSCGEQPLPVSRGSHGALSADSHGQGAPTDSPWNGNGPPTHDTSGRKLKFRSQEDRQPEAPPQGRAPRPRGRASDGLGGRSWLLHDSHPVIPSRLSRPTHEPASHPASHSEGVGIERPAPANNGLASHRSLKASAVARLERMSDNMDAPARPVAPQTRDPATDVQPSGALGPALPAGPHLDSAHVSVADNVLGRDTPLAIPQGVPELAERDENVADAQRHKEEQPSQQNAATPRRDSDLRDDAEGVMDDPQAPLRSPRDLDLGDIQAEAFFSRHQTLLDTFADDRDHARSSVGTGSGNDSDSGSDDRHHHWRSAHSDSSRDGSEVGDADISALSAEVSEELVEVERMVEEMPGPMTAFKRMMLQVSAERSASPGLHHLMGHHGESGSEIGMCAGRDGPQAQHRVPRPISAVDLRHRHHAHSASGDAPRPASSHASGHDGGRSRMKRLDPRSALLECLAMCKDPDYKQRQLLCLILSNMTGMRGSMNVTAYGELVRPALRTLAKDKVKSVQEASRVAAAKLGWIFAE
ncbi:unnamed protein product [Pedinophyceae sp. YPF-701]|nr:unnamed protein product [Pedinophyceae sp. YPF-701]